MLEITETAVQQFKKLLIDAGADGSGIRIFANSNACCPSYSLDVTEKGEAGDVHVEKDGLNIFIEYAASAGLANAKIDYVTEGEKRGFNITGISSSCC